MHRIEHDHSLADLSRVVHHLPALASASSDTECGSCHKNLLTQRRKGAETQSFRDRFLCVFASLRLCVEIHQPISSITCFSSAGISGIVTLDISIAPLSPFLTAKLNFEYSGSLFG